MRITLAALLVVSLAVSALPSSAGEPSVGRSGIVVQAVFDRLQDETDEWFHQGDYLRCIHACRMYISYDPSELSPYFTAAWLLWSAGLDNEAQNVYQQSVRAAPESWEPYMEIGLHWSGRREDRLAALWLTHACLRGAPVQAWKTLAHSYRKLGLLPEAISVMEHAGQLDPEDEAIWRNLDWMRETLRESRGGPGTEPPAAR